MVPERCQRQFKEGEEWNCFFGYKVYPTLRCEWRLIEAFGKWWDILSCTPVLKLKRLDTDRPYTVPQKWPCLYWGEQSFLLTWDCHNFIIKTIGPKQTSTVCNGIRAKFICFLSVF